jgi:hypothetical protein
MSHDTDHTVIHRHLPHCFHEVCPIVVTKIKTVSVHPASVPSPVLGFVFMHQLRYLVFQPFFRNISVISFDSFVIIEPLSCILRSL